MIHDNAATNTAEHQCRSRRIGAVPVKGRELYLIVRHAGVSLISAAAVYSMGTERDYIVSGI